MGRDEHILFYLLKKEVAIFLMPIFFRIFREPLTRELLQLKGQLTRNNYIFSIFIITTKKPIV